MKWWNNEIRIRELYTLCFFYAEKVLSFVQVENGCNERGEIRKQRKEELMYWVCCIYFWKRANLNLSRDKPQFISYRLFSSFFFLYLLPVSLFLSLVSNSHFYRSALSNIVYDFLAVVPKCGKSHAQYHEESAFYARSCILESYCVLLYVREWSFLFFERIQSESGNRFDEY